MSNPLIRWFLVIIIVLTSLWFVKDVPIREDALDLLPGEQMRADLSLLREIGLVDRIFLSLEITAEGSQEGLRSSARNIGSSLQESSLFSQVVYQLPQGFEGALADIFYPALPSLFGPDDLEWLQDRITEEGIRQVMQENFALLNSPAGLAVKQQIIRDPLGLLPHFLGRLQELRGELAVSVQNGFFVSQDGKHCLLWAESATSLTDSQHAKRVDGFIREILDEKLAPGITARIIGPLPHTVVNAQTVEKDLKRLLPLAFIALLLLLLTTLKKLRAVFVVAIPFFAAPLAVLVVAHVFGAISIMALGFGIVLLGISVDFAVHIYLAQTRGESNAQDRLHSLRQPIGMASATTLGVFAVLLFSSVPSHRQMALLALIGVGLAVLFSWFLVPIIAGNNQSALSKKNMKPWSLEIPKRYAWCSVALWAVLVVGGALAWPELHFSGDLRAMDVSSAQIKEDEEVFRQVWRQGDDQAFIIARGETLQDALDKNDGVYHYLKREKIHSFQSLAGVLPGPAVQQDNRIAWQAFWQKHQDALASRFQRISEEFGFVPGAYAHFFDWLQEESKNLAPNTVLESPLGPLFLSLLQSQQEPGVAKDFQPVYITTLTQYSRQFERVVSQIETELEGVHVVSPVKWRADVENLLQKDIVGLSLAAGILIVLLVSVFFRDVRGVAGSLAPVLAALSAMALFDYVSSRDLNLMHLLMVIMVIGLAVDYGIFAVCAARKVVDRTALLGVSICAASTLSGFGILALAVHPALHAIGLTVLVGIGAAWPTAVFVTPVIAGCPRGNEE